MSDFDNITPYDTDPNSDAGFSALSAAPAPAPAPEPAPPAPDASSLVIQRNPNNVVASPQPQAPQAPQPSKWERILTGALVGLSGGMGAKNFGQGLAGGARASLDYAQTQTENKQRQQQIDQQQAETQQRIKFMNAQAASMAADTALKDAQLHALPQELQDKHTATALEQLKFMQDLGLTPVLAVDNKQGGKEAMTGLQQLTDSHGAVPPLFTINVGKQIIGFDLNQLSAAPQALDQVNKIRAIQGQPALTPQAWAQLPDQAKAIQTNSAFSFWNPIPSEQNLAIYRNYLNTAKAAPESPEKAANVAKLDSLVSGMQSGLDTMNARENKQAADKARTQIPVEAAKAQAVARAAVKGQVQGQMEALGGGNGIGEDFLKTLPAGRQKYLMGVAEGRIEVPARALATKDGQLLAMQMSQAFPGWDMSRTPAYFQTRKAFTSGRESRGMNSLNTALGHIGHLHDATTWTATVPGVSGMARAFGGDHAKAFQYYKKKVGEEINQAYVNGALTESDKRDADTQLNEWMPWNVREGEKALTTLLTSKLKAYVTQWENAKPSPAISDFPVISQDSAGIIKKITGEDVPFITPQASRTTQPVTHTGTVPPGARPILRNGQPIGYIQNGQRVDF